MRVHLRSPLATFATGFALSASVAVASAAGAAPAVAASDTASPVAHHFPISVAELEAKHAAMFAAADADGNGLVSFDEFEAHGPARGQRHGHPRPGRKAGGFRFHEGDTIAIRSHTGDGGPPQAKREEMQAELFDELDSNADGQISREEFSSENRRAARTTVRKRQVFARLDLNSDGVLSAEEFPPRHLIGLDTDGDGQITREELRSRRGHGPRGPHQRAG